MGGNDRYEWQRPLWVATTIMSGKDRYEWQRPFTKRQIELEPGLSFRGGKIVLEESRRTLSGSVIHTIYISSQSTG